MPDEFIKVTDKAARALFLNQLRQKQGSSPVAIDPRMKLMIVAVRRAMLILYDALGEYAGLDAR